ncbi:MAG: ATP-dependent helicase HrpB [Pseudomonadota bacterium]
MLPVEEVLPSLVDALEAGTTAVLVAPPGAGKSTLAPLRFLDAPWMAGRKILMLEPRRLAARAVAARLAANLGEAVGATVGFRVRLESRVSAATRLEVVTEGVFARMILDDPGLEGVGLVIFDEFHERSLDADLGLALAEDCRRVLRPDLRLLVMSATLDGAAVAGLLGGAPVIASEGRSWPVETVHLGRDPGASVEDQAARAVRRALAETPGGVLVFLPGQAEIRRTAERLEANGLPGNVDLAPLYGALDPAAQDRAIAPAPAGRRKVVLATDIAETSLTLEGIGAVVDAGLVRSPRFDPGSGVSRLVTLRASRAAADQRRGRAGRTGPGTCYRLWDEAETRALPAFAPPEILNADLSGLALDLARWGVKDAGELAFLDPPPAGALTEARSLLSRLGALDGQGVLTAHGEALSRLPLPPRLAHMVLAAAARGQAARAARIAVLASEPGLGGRDPDLRQRLEALERDRGGRATEARRLAQRWSALAEREATRADEAAALDDGLLLALAWPERVARARGPLGHFQLASGRGVWLEETDPLAREAWLAVGELGGGRAPRPGADSGAVRRRHRPRGPDRAWPLGAPARGPDRAPGPAGAEGDPGRGALGRPDPRRPPGPGAGGGPGIPALGGGRPQPAGPGRLPGGAGRGGPAGLGGGGPGPGPGGLAGSGAGRPQGPGGPVAGPPGRRPGRTAGLRRPEAAGRPGAVSLDRADGQQLRHRLCGARRAAGGGEGAGGVWPWGPSGGGERSGAPDPGPDLAGAPADPDHPGPAGLLARVLAGGAGRDAGALSPPCLAGGPRLGGSDLPGQTPGNLRKIRSLRRRS